MFFSEITSIVKTPAQKQGCPGPDRLWENPEFHASAMQNTSLPAKKQGQGSRDDL
ncbi:MAG: hypothetical protein K9J81_06585 [Desulfohalobiaceae bacterium]|nr:hypothetical protein [Desulfohalobiaceae bacterium]